jgi:hypothetical protein
VELFPSSPHLQDAKIDRKSGLKARGDCPAEQVVLEKVIESRDLGDEGCAAQYPESARDVRAQ